MKGINKMDAILIKKISDAILANLTHDIKVQFSDEEQAILQNILKLKDDNPNNLDIQQACLRSLQNFDFIANKIKFNMCLDAGIDIAKTIISTSASSAMPEFSAVTSLITDAIADKVKELYR